MWKCKECKGKNDNKDKHCVNCGGEKTQVKSNKRRNLIVGAILAAVIVVFVLWLIFGFLQQPDSTGTAVIGADTYSELTGALPDMMTDGIAAEINGVQVSKSDWEHYLRKEAEKYASNQNTTIDKVDWSKKDKNGQTALEEVKFYALRAMIQDVVLDQKIDAWGIALTEEEKAQAAEVSERMGVTDGAEYEKLCLRKKVFNTVNKELEKYSKGADLSLFATDKNATVKFIEISKMVDNDQIDYKDAEKQITKIKERLDGGERFDDLWYEFMDKERSSKMGDKIEAVPLYEVIENEWLPEQKNVETAELSLKPGEISGIIETKTSYMIIARVEGYTEVLNMEIAESEIGINKTLLAKSKIIQGEAK